MGILWDFLCLPLLIPLQVNSNPKGGVHLCIITVGLGCSRQSLGMCSGHHQPVAWAPLLLYLEELESLRLQGLRGQRGEGGVQPIFAVAQNGVLPKWRVCTTPKSSSGYCRELTSTPPPHLSLWGSQWLRLRTALASSSSDQSTCSCTAGQEGGHHFTVGLWQRE